ncbi:hypothetical protein [Neobacillus kokaensis]|uniref:Stage 0 sporulation regulatory protein n=1 Tax=Neobacillus kokaensis TaxID=2759023 RepID=A0ABQ3N9X0_9BACI|nr:hypothetical protein [Neobacillus kokaensis]GHH98411.1 hypothetical protein AM1BK_19540 [Neobacillus kokaensis]
MNKRRKTPPRIPIEEFSLEYGEVNGVPLIETKDRTKKNNSLRKK